MARSARDIQTDLDRIGRILKAARVVDNQDTLDILEQANARLESEFEDLSKDTDATRRSSIDTANAELIAYENEADVSPVLKAALQDSRGDLVTRRRSHE
jgi:hypothetical protein